MARTDALHIFGETKQEIRRGLHCKSPFMSHKSQVRLILFCRSHISATQQFSSQYLLRLSS